MRTFDGGVSADHHAAARRGTLRLRADIGFSGLARYLPVVPLRLVMILLRAFMNMMWAILRVESLHLLSGEYDYRGSLPNVVSGRGASHLKCSLFGRE